MTEQSLQFAYRKGLAFAAYMHLSHADQPTRRRHSKDQRTWSVEWRRRPLSVRRLGALL